MAENWKDIEGYEGLYQVSNYGRIKSLERKRFNNGGYQLLPEKIMIPNKDRGGYLRLHTCINYNYKFLSIHRLVAQHFIPNPDNLTEINHKDSDKTNNNVSNLEWCTRSENLKHAYKNKLRSSTGNQNGNSKLNENDVLVIREMLKTKTGVEIARIYDVSHVCIYDIKNGKRWNHV